MQFDTSVDVTQSLIELILEQKFQYSGDVESEQIQESLNSVHMQFTSQEIVLNQTFRQSAAVFFSGWEYSVGVWGL